ncbi:MAG: hypothetical protein ACRDYX_01445 [Egibacteraceae bacterium]
MTKSDEYTTDIDDLEDIDEDLDDEDMEEDLHVDDLTDELDAGLDVELGEGPDAGLNAGLEGEVLDEDEEEDDDESPGLEDDEDDEEDEEEEALDVLLARDTGLNEDLVRLDDEPRDGLGNADAPIGAGEFTCRSCFLVKRRPQLADEERMVCLDCV